MKRRYWALLAIAAGRETGLTPVQLQKALFLLGRECANEIGEPDDFYHFEPYDYGPFDVEVYEDARQLKAEGLITISPVPGRRWNCYRATPEGKGKADSTREKMPGGCLQKQVDWVKSQRFSQLVRAIYEKYPEMAANSVFQMDDCEE